VHRILLSAGEPSGDLHGAAVARALRAQWPDARLYGLGGPLMQSEGVELLAHVDDLAVMGFAEVAGRLPFFLRLLSSVRRHVRQDPPDLVSPIDYPGFNLRLAKAARRAGAAVLYYIAPQVWAWHRSRVRQLVRWTDHLAVILPFEEEIFRAAGARATFVGHPLLDRPAPALTRDQLCGALGLEAGRPILALFPGSRRQEVDRHGKLFAEAAAHVVRVRPDVQAVVAAGGSIAAAAFRDVHLPRTGDAWALLRHAEAAIVKSGTSTLEAALSGTPLVVAYRMNPTTYALARRLVRVDHIGLVTLVAGERLVPERIQQDATAASLAAAVLPLLDRSSEERRRVEAGLARVHAALHAPGPRGSAAGRVAAIAAGLLENRA
jgi:lipid-A-disaccharide synthase